MKTKSDTPLLFKTALLGHPVGDHHLRGVAGHARLLLRARVADRDAGRGYGLAYRQAGRQLYGTAARGRTAARYGRGLLRARPGTGATRGGRAARGRTARGGAASRAARRTTGRAGTANRKTGFR